MAFFKKDTHGKIVFSGGRHNGEEIEKVARTDPGYLRWARKERTIGIPTELFDFIEEVMTRNSVPFTRKRASRKKSS